MSPEEDVNKIIEAAAKNKAVRKALLNGDPDWALINARLANPDDQINLDEKERDAMSKITASELKDLSEAYIKVGLTKTKWKDK